MGLLSRLIGSSATTPSAAAVGVDEGSLVLVDVRETGEWRAGHAPKARHIPLSTLSGELERLAKEGRRVAFVCQSGMRSARATRMARAAGIDATNVKGGMAAWSRAGLPVTQGGNRAARRARR